MTLKVSSRKSARELGLARRTRITKALVSKLESQMPFFSRGTRIIASKKLGEYDIETVNIVASKYRAKGWSVETDYSYGRATIILS